MYETDLNPTLPSSEPAEDLAASALRAHAWYGEPFLHAGEDPVAALADEARHILDEGVASSAGEIDACLILGAGFPFFRGGLTPYLDHEGVSTRVSGRPLGRQ